MMSIGDHVATVVAEANDMHPQAKRLLADEATTPGLRWTMMKTAIKATDRSVSRLSFDDATT